MLGFNEITEDNYMQFWDKLNKIIADQDKCSRIINHKIKYSKRSFYDYSSMAYNNSADDF